MKKIIKFIIPVFAFLLIEACAESDDQITISPSSVSPSLLEVSNNVINLFDLQHLPNNPALTLTWTEADFGVQSPITYDVEMSTTQDFASFASFPANGQRTISWTVNELNVETQKAGLPIEIESDLYVRVVAKLGSSVSKDVVSETAVLKVTTYFAYLFKDYFLVGAATQPGWENNNNNPPLFRSEADSDLYEYVGYFNADAFKVLEFLGQWQPQWGTDDGVTLSGNPATRPDDPGVFNAPGAGYYTFTFDIDARTFTMREFDESQSADYTSITITGDATAMDVSLTQSTFDSHIWYANGIDLSSGTINFTDSNGGSWGNTNEFHGKATPNGAGIPITERNYNIWFNDLTGAYMIIPTF